MDAIPNEELDTGTGSEQRNLMSRFVSKLGRGKSTMIRLTQKLT